MPEGTGTAVAAAVLTLTVVAFITLVAAKRSRLSSKYLSPSSSSTVKDERESCPPSPMQAAAAPAAARQAVASSPATSPAAAAAELAAIGTAEPEAIGNACSAQGQGPADRGGDDVLAALHPLLRKTEPPLWENPLVLGVNKQRARPTLGSFSSVAQARWGGWGRGKKGRIVPFGG